MFTGLEFVKCLIIISMMYIFTKTHVKNLTPDTPHIPLREPLIRFVLILNRIKLTICIFTIYALHLYQPTFLGAFTGIQSVIDFACFVYLHTYVHAAQYLDKIAEFTTYGHHLNEFLFRESSTLLQLHSWQVLNFNQIRKKNVCIYVILCL